MTKRSAEEPERITRSPQQDRGLRRVETILDAAADVIAEVGVDAATMSDIAERSGASVGSLYHFFPGKEGVLEALAQRYTRELVAINERALSFDEIWLPLPELFDRIVNGLAEFHERTPAFRKVHDATFGGVRGGTAHLDLDRAIVDSVTRLLALRLPRLTPDAREVNAVACVKAVHALIEEAMFGRPEMRGPLLRELKAMMVRYYEPLQEAYGPTTSPSVATSRRRQ